MQCSSDNNTTDVYLAYRDDADHQLNSKDPVQEMLLPFPSDYGEGKAAFYALDQDLGYGVLDIKESTDSGRFVGQSSENFMKLTMHVSRQPSIFTVGGFSDRLKVRQGDGYLLSGPAYGIIEVERGEHFSEFSLFISEEKFWQANDEMEIIWPRKMEGAMLNLSDNLGYINTPTGKLSRAATVQLLQSPLKGAIRRFYIEAKLLEILSLRLHELHESVGETKTQLNLTRTDRHHLEEARDILYEEAFSPPTILELSRRVGLNTTRLKEGFRERYGFTLFGYVRHIRMGHAYLLLSEGDMSVGEAALSVGYNSFSSFSKAFYHYYGVLPSMLLK